MGYVGACVAEFIHFDQSCRYFSAVNISVATLPCCTIMNPSVDQSYKPIRMNFHRGVKLTVPYLVPSLRMSGSLPPLTLYTAMMWTGTNLLYFPYIIFHFSFSFLSYFLCQDFPDVITTVSLPVDMSNKQARTINIKPITKLYVSRARNEFIPLTAQLCVGSTAMIVTNWTMS
jgi:hypothetical protein